MDQIHSSFNTEPSLTEAMIYHPVDATGNELLPSEAVTDDDTGVVQQTMIIRQLEAIVYASLMLRATDESGATLVGRRDAEMSLLYTLAIENIAEAEHLTGTGRL